MKKPKLEKHYQMCHAAVTCIDCFSTFNSPGEFKGHTSCISEAEKYQKSLYKGPKVRSVPSTHHRLLCASPTLTPFLSRSSRRLGSSRTAAARVAKARVSTTVEVPRTTAAARTARAEVVRISSSSPGDGRAAAEAGAAPDAVTRDLALTALLWAHPCGCRL